VINLHALEDPFRMPVNAALATSGWGSLIIGSSFYCCGFRSSY
jgi:hypothetical protein